jgi:hypothetical protein
MDNPGYENHGSTQENAGRTVSWHATADRKIDSIPGRGMAAYLV